MVWVYFFAHGKSVHNKNTVIVSLLDDLSVRTNGYDRKGNIFITAGQRSLHSIAQTATARYSHPGDSNGPDIVVLKDFGQLFRIVHHVKLGATNQCYLIAHEILVEVAIGIRCAISSNQQIRIVKIGRIRR